ncbi:di-trans,poly-cis-decaprenylcistransferase [Egibacter rhizosphaerae]|uniref:Isoprenyl transferase n=1 Tax=Egibacter rhizosphaerae TaxID=1670831 RepID=A0A411YIX5_9ACTN|nr:polyprenyl diphosphate synthase [Egibacter rhizosphaerae]QBI21147.1 di-trans,poly-cis-decaprenylcistransferase [Egibacter rhizosphaerae]
MRDLLYRLYERRLAAGLDVLPRHVALILDGNRRFARERGLGDPSEGHRLGARKVDELVEWCHELDIPYVTLWLLSTENLQRDENEVANLLEVIGQTVDRLVARSSQRGIQITPVGALDGLPDPLRRVLKHAQEATADGDRLHVQVAVGYGGRQEIVDALRGVLHSRLAAGDDLGTVAGDLTLEEVADHLYTTGLPDPDLIIRTSGELRLSGFLLWQSVHSEFHFCDAYWPEFRKTDFLRALRDYASRERRFGS